MRFTTILAASSAMLVAAPAFAQDADAPFTGPRAEVLLGYDNISGGNDESDSSSDGFSYGGGVGFDFQLGGFIAGIEGEYMDSTSELNANDADLPGNGDFQLHADRDLYVGARIGGLIGPSTMLYVKGGYTNAEVTGRYADTAGTFYEEGATLDGWRAGIGVEHAFKALSPSAFVKLEYRYSNYSNLDVSYQDGLDGEEIADIDIDTDRHQVLVGIGARF